MQFDFEGFKKWHECVPEALFNAKVIKFVNPEIKDVAVNLEYEARRADTLVIWTDCDREGENIGMEIVQVCTKINPKITVKRARFSVIQNREIHYAMNNLTEIDVLQSNAVDARSEIDLRIGAAFTRYLTLRFQNLSQELQNNIISYGSCQFPTLGFVVDQYKKVEKFIPEPFWKLQVQTLDKEGKFQWDRNHLFDHDAVVAFFMTCGSTAKVYHLDSHVKRKYKPLPLTTIDMQKLGTRMLKMSSDQIMSVAEKLYQQGYISYPRTETNEFEDNFDLEKLICAQFEDPKWGDYAKNLMPSNFERPRKGKKNDKAHPPIHPTKCGKTLSGDDRRVYELITRRFLACCSKDAIGNETTVKIKVNEEGFHASGLIILERNYLDVYVYDKWSDNVIPSFQNNQQFPCRCEIIEGSTSSPTLLTEAELIGLMDKNGIGTDATIHEHIKKIVERQYVVVENGLFSPSKLGIALVDGLDKITDCSLAKPELRALMERNLVSICDGSCAPDQVIKNTVNEYQKMYQKIVKYGLSIEDELRKNLTFVVDTNGVVTCLCGRPASLRVTKKPGPNKGRSFRCCGEQQQCNFFEWADDVPRQDKKKRVQKAPQQKQQRKRKRQ